MAEILHIEISWKHVSVTYDLDLWPTILKIFVSHRVPILNVYVKFHDDRLRNDWDITLWNFAKTRTNTDKHTHKHTNTQTNKQTWALQYLALPLWGRGNNRQLQHIYRIKEQLQHMYRIKKQLQHIYIIKEQLQHIYIIKEQLQHIYIIKEQLQHIYRIKGNYSTYTK